MTSSNKLKYYGKEVEEDFLYDCVGKGWHPILRELFDQLFAIGWDGDVHQIKEKFGCYDEETRVLTKEGFKYFKNVSYEDKVATLNSNGEVEYHRPSDIISYHYEGDMYRLKTRGVDLLVTPNHNLYVAKGSYYNGNYTPPKRVDYNFELTTYQKYFGKNKRFLKGFNWKGEYQDRFHLPGKSKRWKNGPTFFTGKEWKEMSIDMNSWLKLLGWFVSEGSTCKNQSTFSVCYLEDKNELPIISKIIEDCGFNPSFNEDKATSAINVMIYDGRLAEWLRENCGHKASNKKVPTFVKELCPEQIKIFLENLYQGDGCKHSTSHILTTTSERLKDDVCELILKAGDTFSYWKREPRKSKKVTGVHSVYEINWLKNSNDHNTSNKGRSKSSIEEIQKYSGMVYCLTVPNHIMYIERGGKGVWCGNSLRFYIGKGNPLVYRLILDAETKSLKICEVCGEPGRCSGWGRGWIRTLCEKHGEEYRQRGFQ